jgi:hypothetical protein
LRGNLRDAADLMQDMTAQLERFLHISDHMGKRLDELRRRQQQDEPDAC